MTAITQALKDSIYYKVNVARQDRDVRGKREFRKGIGFSMERAWLMTDAYRRTEGEPEVIRRAKALSHILDNMTIYIKDGQKLVGNPSANPWSIELFPELGVKWVEEEVNDSLSNMLDEGGRKEWAQIMEYWQGRNLEDRTLSLLPDPIKEYADFNGVSWPAQWRLGLAAQSINYQRIFDIGLKGIISEAQEKLDELKTDITIHPHEYINKRNFLEAALITLNGAIRHSHRFSEKARTMASAESNAEKKGALEEIAAICDQVPENPPKTLHEAMQCFWFVFVINRFIEIRGQGWGERIDQLMYPFYKKDIEEGRITREDAQELVEMIFIEQEEAGLPSHRDTGQAGVSWFPTFTIGGVTSQGEDAVNEFSFIVLDAAKNIRTSQTNIALRYHGNTDPEFILQAIDVVRSGLGYPAFFNDDVFYRFAVESGFSPEEARNYGIHACVVWFIPGKSLRQSSVTAALVNLAKCLELALNQGYDHVTKKQLGCKTPEPKEFKSYDDVMEAYLEQVRFTVDKLTKIVNISQELRTQHLACPFASALVDGCIERGKDYHLCGERSQSLLLPAGNTNVADSLSAIKKFVFDDKRVSMDELVEMLRNDFEGNEEFRLMLLNDAPKFGNDDDYVDSIADDLHSKTQDVVAGFNDIYGNPWSLDGSMAGGYYPWGKRAMASADGRKNKESLSDAVLSPSAGRDNKGPTAVLKSMSKVNPMWSNLSNQKFFPQSLEGENREKFAAYLKTWFDLGNSHIQFNVADKATLVEAQKQPEQHSDLIVRIAGYSAYFVDLSKGLQDDIISRASQRF